MMLGESILDETFPHAYECETREEVPNDALSHYYFPGATAKGGKDGLLVQIRPTRGESWLGTFAFGQVTPEGVSGVFTTPNPQQVCVVSRGQGYLVNTWEPSDWQAVRATPIISIHPIPSQHLIVFADHTTLIAYGHSGVQWKTARLSWDHLHITEVTDKTIKGEFWNIRSEAKEYFVVDLMTGGHQGGITEI